jgi:hypothetical protein
MLCPRDGSTMQSDHSLSERRCGATGYYVLCWATPEENLRILVRCGARAARFLDHPMSCLPAALEVLTRGGCMERASLLQGSQPIASLPVYVAHAGRLRRRRRFVRAQLRALGAPDVTMVLCADAEEVARLTVTQRRCLHPNYARTRWSPTLGMLQCRECARCGWPAPPERLIGRGWPEPGVV